MSRMAAIGCLPVVMNEGLAADGRSSARRPAALELKLPRAGTHARLVDTAEGPNWYQANVPLNIRWERPGGDWSDATGLRWGNRAFASCTVRSNGSQTLTWEVKALILKLLADNTGIMLRSGGGMKLAASRTAGQPAPTLIVDGVACPLLADTWVDVSGGNFGRLDWLQTPALLKFDLSGVTAPVQSATLSVVLMNLYTQPPPTVDAYYLEMPVIVTDPAVQLGGVRTGIASTVIRDQALAQHPSVVRYSELSSYKDVHDGSWFINPRVDFHGHKGGDWTYEPTYVPVPQYGLTIGRACIPGAPDQGSGAGAAMHRWTYPPDARPKPWQVPLQTGPQELYLRYLLRIDADVFDGMRPDGGVKLPGLSGSYEYQNTLNVGNSGWVYRIEHGSPSRAHPGLFRPFVYAYDFTAPIGTGSGEPLYFGRNMCFKAGQLYAIEQYVKLNTRNPDGTWNADGIIRQWVDGVLAFEVATRMIRQDANVGFYDIPFLNIYHGGTLAPNKDIHYEIGAVCVAHEYIGPPTRIGTASVAPIK